MMIRFLKRGERGLFCAPMFSALFVSTVLSENIPSLLCGHAARRPSAFLNKHGGISTTMRGVSCFASASTIGSSGRSFASSSGPRKPRSKSSLHLQQSGDYHAPAAGQITLESMAESLKSGNFKRVLVVTGAGVSCSAGIPDFRSPGTGLYDNLHKFQLPYPEAIFDLDFYRGKPEPFVTLAKEIWPGVKYRPTLTHCFLRLLDEKGILGRIYTQNIDGLDVVAGTTPEKIVECHGNFRAAACTTCRTPFDIEKCKVAMLEDGKAPLCEEPSCQGIIKPDVVFYGEALPGLFSQVIDADVAGSDFLIVIGTSLLVAPVSQISQWVPKTIPRLLINMERVGDFNYGRKTDVFMEGFCDDSVRKLCQLVGWEKELDDMYEGLR